MDGKAVSTVKSFKEIWGTLPSGWLREAEAELLYRTAQQTAGDILEVGCYFGRSSVLLASLGRTVHCVDPFDGFTDDLTGDAIEARWKDSIKSRGITNTIQYRQRVESWVPRPCGFAYLDGDHTEEGTKQQITAAIMCGVRLMCVHDVADSGGGAEVKRGILSVHCAKIVEIVDTMAVVKWEGIQGLQ